MLTAYFYFHSFAGMIQRNVLSCFRIRARHAMAGWVVIITGVLMKGTAAVAQIDEPIKHRYVDQYQQVDLRDMENDGTLTLPQAVSLVLQHNPELAAAAREINAFEGTRLQASVFRNPDFITEAEEINSHNPNIQPFVTLRISQLFELGGKRHARMNVAEMGQEVARQAYEARRVEIMARTADAFVDVLEGQALVEVLENTLQLAGLALSTADKRVAADKAPPMESIRSKVNLSTVSVELEQARRNLATAKSRLALLWGESIPRFGQVKGELESFVTLPTLDRLLEHIEANPVLLQSSKQVAQREAQLDLENARRIPDIRLGAAIRRYLELDQNTALLDMSIPIPIFDRNQGNRLEAQQRVYQARDQRMAVELQLKTELIRVYESLLAAQRETQTLRDEVLPGAQKAFELTNRGYQLGKFSFLEMLDAQRAYFQNRTLYVRALANYQRLINALERLVAAPLEHFTQPSAATHFNGNHP